jgi:hypothetical protein
MSDSLVLIKVRSIAARARFKAEVKVVSERITAKVIYICGVEFEVLRPGNYDGYCFLGCDAVQSARSPPVSEERITYFLSVEQ